MNAPTRDEVLKNIDLSHCATLVRVKIGKWSPYSFDENATKRAYGTSKNGRANKHLMKDSMRLKATMQAFTNIGTWHTGRSGAWLDDGFRMVLTERLDEHMKELRRLTNVANATLADLERHWDEEIEKDRKRFQDAADIENAKRVASGHAPDAVSDFDIEDYPTNIRERFYVEVRPMPVPNNSHFAQTVHKEEREAFAQAMVEAVQNADTKAAEEIGSVLLPLVNKLTQYKGEKGTRWHPSLIENVLDLAGRFRCMNITGNPILANLVKDLESMAQSTAFDSDVLKESQEARDAAKSKLDKIVAKLDAYNMGGAI